MRKTALTGLIFLFLSSPCLAQTEVQGLCTIDGTLWATMPSQNNYLGFLDGFAYGCYICKPEEESCVSPYCDCMELFLTSYVDSPMISSYTIDGGKVIATGYLLPLLGIGIEFETFGYGMDEEDYYQSRILFKYDNNWLPPCE